jgi:mannan endo-1,4-beta-mannosidase
MKQISILFFTLLLLGACVKAPTQTDNFVKIVDGRFSINDKPYYYSNQVPPGTHYGESY